MALDSLDLALATMPYFRRLRPDERASVAGAMRVLELAPGAQHEIGAGDAVLVVVLEGQVSLVRAGVGGISLGEGDWTDDLRAVSGNGRPGALAAQESSRVAVLDKAALDALFERLPVIAVPLLAEIGREAQRRNDLLREVALARNSGLPPQAFQALVLRRRRRMQRHRHVSAARISALLWRALVIEPSRRLTFWMFLGAILALASARTVVAMIIHNGLQSHLFALIGGGPMGHPLHVHHFNYGLLLVSLVGLLSFLPRTRRALRTLSFAFGFGLGLVVDEFALLWNLNPDYYQPSSRLAAALVLFALFQIVYFRSLYKAMGRRLVAWIRP